jgi:putative hemolysin
MNLVQSATVADPLTTKPRRPKLSYAAEVDKLPKKVLIHAIEFATGRRKLEKIYAQVADAQTSNQSFWEATLNALQVKLVYNREPLAALPASGPVILIANHPYGVLDGLTMCYLAAQIRPNFRILVNAALCREDRIAEYTLPIDFAATEAATRTNLDSKRKALEVLQAGGALVIFPAGAISTAISPFGQVTDMEWKLFAAKLIQASKATVLPVFFHGHNGRLFQMVSQFSLTLRLALIIHEVKKKMAHPLYMRIGLPIPYAQLAGIKSRKALIDHLRQVTYALGGIPQPDPSRYKRYENNFVRKSKVTTAPPVEH